MHSQFCFRVAKCSNLIDHIIMDKALKRTYSFLCFSLASCLTLIRSFGVFCDPTVHYSIYTVVILLIFRLFLNIFKPDMASFSPHIFAQISSLYHSGPKRPQNYFWPYTRNDDTCLYIVITLCLATKSTTRHVNKEWNTLQFLQQPRDNDYHVPC